VKTQCFDLIIVGGGLAGLMAAASAEARGAKTVLIDAGVPGTPGALGGFAPFSGAKFSLAPAGSGLAPLVGGSNNLVSRYAAICSEFIDLGFEQFRVSQRELEGEETEVGDALAFRNYHSILLSPCGIDRLLASLAARLQTTDILRSRVSALKVVNGQPLRVVLEDERTLQGQALIVAAGRLGATLLSEAGVPESRGKGIDVGVRLGFDQRVPLAGLRALGPDAKFLADGVRTFCLNSPGRIFHYPGLGFELPGGIVAASSWEEANVGILCRLSNRQEVLAQLAAAAPARNPRALMERGRGQNLGWSPLARSILGEHVIDRVENFIAKLTASGLVSLPETYDVHYPLLDWHWPVFSRRDRLETAVAGVVAAGDTSGHARGLMQAAVMGLMAVEEALS